jgi:lambda family phage minor tail protein L
MAIESEIQKLALSARVELFEVDLTSLGDSVYRFHAGTNQLSQPIIWQGNTYAPWPCQATGFDYNTRGQLPRPKLVLANVSGAITALVLLLNDCVGAKVTRKLTLLKFLDAANFPGGVNPTADPNAHLPDEIYFIDRKATENSEIVEFELTAPFDVTGVMLPRRQIIQNICPWKYRGSECGYTGTNYFNADDTQASSLAQDVCGKRLSSCKKRFGENSELPYGGFPGAGQIQ